MSHPKNHVHSLYIDNSDNKESHFDHHYALTIDTVKSMTYFTFLSTETLITPDCVTDSELGNACVASVCSLWAASPWRDVDVYEHYVNLII